MSRTRLGKQRDRLRRTGVGFHSPQRPREDLAGFINVDPELTSKADLRELISGLGDRIHDLNPVDGERHFVNFEVSRFFPESRTGDGLAEATIADCGRKKGTARSCHESRLSRAVLRRVLDLSAEIVITVYALHEG